MSDAAVIHQAYRFALDPTVQQEHFLAGCAGASRFWFNQGLGLVKQRLDGHSDGVDVAVPWSYKSLCVAFRGDAIKDRLAPWRREVVIGSYQAGLEALGRALQNYSAAKAPDAGSASLAFAARVAVMRPLSSSARASRIAGT